MWRQKSDEITRFFNDFRLHPRNQPRPGTFNERMGET
jgi:hypothetical protein